MFYGYDTTKCLKKSRYIEEYQSQQVGWVHPCFTAVIQCYNNQPWKAYCEGLWGHVCESTCWSVAKSSESLEHLTRVIIQFYCCHLKVCPALHNKDTSWIPVGQKNAFYYEPVGMWELFLAPSLTQVIYWPPYSFFNRRGTTSIKQLLT
jgi:hypothetical protein